MYGFPKVTKQDVARYMHFKTKYKPKVGARSLDGITFITPNTIPPC